VKSQSRAPQMTARAGFAVSGTSHGMVPSNRRALEVDLRRTGGPIVQGGGEVWQARPPAAHLSVYSWQELALGDRVKQTP
jgi:hypothetical protein